MTHFDASLRVYGTISRPIDNNESFSLLLICSFNCVLSPASFCLQMTFVTDEFLLLFFVC